MTPFFQLLNIALGNRAELDCPISDEQWEDVIAQAKKQAVVGLIFKAMMSLPPEQMPVRRYKIRIALLTEKIVGKNRRVMTEIRQLSEECRAMGLRCCLLKGASLAALYPDPELRQSGDIDLWVDLKHDELLKLVGERWKLGSMCYHHVDAKCFEKGTSVELHIYPTWMNSPFNNRRFHKYLDDVKEVQFTNYDETLGCNVPTPEFNLVFNMMHLYRHLLQEGIGLRQFIDYYYILKNSAPEERRRALQQLNRMGIDRFIPAVMYLMQTCFGLEDEFLLCRSDAKDGEFLLREVELSGNFGKTDSRNRYRINQALYLRVLHRFQHLSRFTRFAASEVLWAPVFKTYQFVWRSLKHYK